MQNKISEYKFLNFTDSNPLDDGSTSEYSFKSISDYEDSDSSSIDRAKVIRKERTEAAEENFNISPIVTKYRGIDEQIESDKKIKLKIEVEREVTKIEEDAAYRGYQEGLKKGREEIYEQTRNACDEKITLLTSMIGDVIKTREELMAKQRLDIYETIRNLTKWVILRELKDDGAYLEKLIEKLILEIHTKSDLLIHVDQKSFESMPEVLEQLTNKLGELTNIRVEIDYDIEGPGIVLDSKNGIINGTLKEQFRSLDGLFSNIGLPFSHDFSLTEEMLNDQNKDIPFKDNDTSEVNEIDNEVNTDIKTDIEGETDGKDDGEL